MYYGQKLVEDMVKKRKTYINYGIVSCWSSSSKGSFSIIALTNDESSVTRPLSLETSLRRVCNSAVRVSTSERQAVVAKTLRSALSDKSLTSDKRSGAWVGRREQALFCSVHSLHHSG